MIHAALYDEDINLIIEKRYSKPLFIPKTKEELLEFKDDLFMTPLEKSNYDELLKYLMKRRKDDEDNTCLALEYCAFLHNRIGVDDKPTWFFDQYNEMGFVVKDEKDIQKLVDLWMKVANNTKTYCNKGYSPNELFKITPRNLDDLKVSFGENLKELFRNGTYNLEEELKKIKEDPQILPSMKKSIIDELQALIDEKKNVA